MTLIEICSVNDKEATKYLEINESLGFNILKSKGKYYTYTHNERVYRAPDAVFTTGHDGTYEFVKE